MPQLMPLLWITSIFMWIFMLMMLIDLYFYMEKNEIVLYWNNINKNYKYLW